MNSKSIMNMVLDERMAGEKIRQRSIASMAIGKCGCGFSHLVPLKGSK